MKFGIIADQVISVCNGIGGCEMIVGELQVVVLSLPV